MGDPKYERWWGRQREDLKRGNALHPVKIRHRFTGRGIVLFLDYWDKVKHHYTFLKPSLIGDKDLDLESIRRAVAARDEMERKIASGTLNEFDPRQDLTNIVKSQISKSPNLARVLLHLKQYSEDKPIPLGRVTSKWTRDFQNYLFSKSLHHNTVTSYMLLLRAVFHRLQDDGWDGKPIKKSDHLRHVETDRTFLTESEVETLAATPCRYPELKRAFLFSCFSGLRISDVRRLKWGDIIKTEDGKYQIKFKQKKLLKSTGGLTFLPLGNEAVRQLFFNQDEKVIPHPEATVFSLPSKTTVDTWINQWARLAGVKKPVTFHAGRHTFAVALLSHGVDIYTASKLLGHSSLVTTQLYARLLPEKLREDVDRLPELRSEIKN